MTVTSTEIARAAGVSRATVSYVLNDNPNQTISEATREAVLKAARELDYRPNAAARSLRSGRGTAVVFPLPGLGQTHVISQLMLSCKRALDAVKLSLVVDFTQYGSVEEQLDAWMKHQPVAVLDLLLRHDDPVLPALKAKGVEVVSAGLGAASGWSNASDAFVQLARRTQVQHLLDAGARQITLILPPHIPSGEGVERRMLAELADLARSSGAVLDDLHCELDAQAVRSVVAAWTRKTLPDAIATYDDDYGIALVTALLAAGHRVPEDVMVIGVDDTPLGRVITPSLSTIAADFDEYADGLAAAIRGSIDQRPLPSHLPTPSHHLVPRESTRRAH